ncbi:MAG TPA: SRPBCC family protein [Rubrobacteraceae bacterium]|nr:SRPBCC family protein [Rubrobacteraceae bacterium]
MPQRVHESIEVQAPLEDVFSYWSNFENFSNFMQNVEEVRMTGQDTSHWKVKGPLGKSVEFDARTTEMDPSRGIGWNTVEGEVMTSGEARLEEVSPGRTRIDVTMNYADPPGGKVGEVAANVFSNPERLLSEDLENVTRVVERGDLGGPGAQSPSR